MYKQNPPETLSVREVAAIYSVHEMTVRRTSTRAGCAQSASAAASG